MALDFTGTRQPARITLHIDKLLADRQISKDEAERLRALAERPGARRVIANVMLIFGAFMVVAGILALEPSLTIGLGLAIAALATGGTLVFRTRDEWGLLGQALVLMGALGLSGWASLQFEELAGIWPYLTAPLIAVVTLAGTVIFRNSVLAALSPIALANLIGSGTSYWHASYGLYIREATLTILLFGLMAAALLTLHRRLPQVHQLNAVIMARVSFIMCNFGFWIGSLWGDHPGEIFVAGDHDWSATQAWRESAVFIPDAVFSFGWLAFLAVALLIGLKTQRRFIANSAIVFMAIHFYTQLHETLFMVPSGLVFAGLSLIGFGFFVFRFDRWLQTDAFGART